MDSKTLDRASSKFFAEPLRPIPNRSTMRDATVSLPKDQNGDTL